MFDVKKTTWDVEKIMSDVEITPSPGNTFIIQLDKMFQNWQTAHRQIAEHVRDIICRVNNKNLQALCM